MYPLHFVGYDGESYSPEYVCVVGVRELKQYEKWTS